MKFIFRIKILVSFCKLIIALSVLSFVSSCDSADNSARIFNGVENTTLSDIEDYGEIYKYTEFTRSAIDYADRHIIKCYKNCVIYFLRDGIIDIGYSDMKLRDVHVKKGMLITGENPITWIENISGHEIDYIIIKSLVSPLIDDPLGPTAYEIESSNLYSHEDDKQTSRILDNKYFNIIELNIMPNETVEPKLYLSGIYYALNAGGEVEHILDIDKKIKISPTHNKIWWVDSSQYSIKNKNTLPAELLFFGIKPVARYAAYEP